MSVSLPSAASWSSCPCAARTDSRSVRARSRAASSGATVSRPVSWSSSVTTRSEETAHPPAAPLADAVRRKSGTSSLASQRTSSTAVARSACHARRRRARRSRGRPIANAARITSSSSSPGQVDDSDAVLAGAASGDGLCSGVTVGVGVAVAVAVAVAVTVLSDVTVRVGVRGGCDDVAGGRADWVGDGSGCVRVGLAGWVRVTDFVGLGRAALTLGVEVRLVSAFGRSPDPPPHDHRSQSHHRRGDRAHGEAYGPGRSSGPPLCHVHRPPPCARVPSSTSVQSYG